MQRKYYSQELLKAIFFRSVFRFSLEREFHFISIWTKTKILSTLKEFKGIKNSNYLLWKYKQLIWNRIFVYTHSKDSLILIGLVQHHSFFKQTKLSHLYCILIYNCLFLDLYIYLFYFYIVVLIIMWHIVLVYILTRSKIFARCS